MMEDRKIIMIGIDSLDKDILKKYISNLPTFKKLFKVNPDIDVISTFPYDSETAWTSIYTGKNPAETGVFNFINVFDKNNKSYIGLNDESIYNKIKGCTIWDELSKKNYKSCIIFPHACYPSWKIKGMMICRSRKNLNNYSIHSDNDILYDLSGLAVLKDYPRENNLNKILIQAEKILNQEIEFCIELLKVEEWDFFFYYSSILDLIQHYFWNYYDLNDEYFKDNDEYKNIIKDYYIKYDTLLNKFMKNNDKDLVIISDHGHKMRPIKLLNINEILRQNELLVKRNNLIYHNYLKKIRDVITHIVSKYQLTKYVMNIFSYMPNLRNLYINVNTEDIDKSMACVSDPSGIKSYSYGGIFLNQNKISSNDQYEYIRSLIITLLNKFNLQHDNVKLFKWIKRRESVYNGMYLYKYPDILYELNDEFGTGWKVNNGFFSKSLTHMIQPGGHKRESAVFLFNSSQPIYNDEAYILNLDNIKNIILQLITNNVLNYNEIIKSYARIKYYS